MVGRISQTPRPDVLLEARKRKIVALALGFFALLLAPVGLWWFTAPADPVYEGIPLSRHLYKAYGGRKPPGESSSAVKRQCDEALAHLGPKAAPLLRAWIENRSSPLHEKLRSFLRKQRIDWPYFTADRQAIVEGLFFSTPAAAVPVAEAFQWQILRGEERDATRAASLLMYVINSVDARSREFIASRSREFAIGLLDRFEADGQDRYALVLVGPVLANSPEAVSLELRERVIALSKKSRYLEAATQMIARAKKDTPATSP